MTAQEVMDNIVSHNACAEGIVWATGKDSDAIWSSTDVDAAPYLFWWAVKNAGQPGWKSSDEVVSVLGSLLCISDYDEAYRAVLEDRLSKVNADFTRNAIQFYSRIESVIGFKNPEAVAPFRLKAFSIIKME